MKSVILLGGGRSVLEGIELDLWNKVKGQEIWSINYGFMTMPYLPAKQIWVDRTFFSQNIDKLESLYKQGVECIAKKNSLYDYVPDVHQYATNRDIYSEDINNPLYLGSMGLSGTLALSLAVCLKYDYIYLLGYDFGTNSINNTKTHYYQDKLAVSSHGVMNPSIYMTNTGVKADVKLYDAYKNYAGKIYNVSMISNISSFPKISYPEFFDLLKLQNI